MTQASDNLPPPAPTFGRALSSLALGATWGAGLVSLGVGAMLVGLQLGSPHPTEGVPSLLVPLIFSMLAAFVVAFFVWFMGLMVVGAPGWWTLHRLGMRSRWAAAALGSVLAPTACAAWSVWIAWPSISPTQTLRDGLVLDAILAAMGAVVGGIVVVHAYRPEPRS
jgi:hypothetical protein